MKISCQELTAGLLLSLLPLGAMADVFEMHYPMEGLAVSESRQAVEDARKEALQVQADKAMCLSERTWTEQETRTRTAYRDTTSWSSWYTTYHDDRYSAIKDRMVTKVLSSGDYCYKWDSMRVCTSSTTLKKGDVKYAVGGTHGSYGNYEYHAIRRSVKTTTREPYTEEYTVNVVHKTAKYDWCASQGYPTQN